jgi:uncharacterized protein YijF (DUF1287 family)
VAGSFLYTVKPGVNLRAGPGLAHKIIQTLNHNQTLNFQARDGRWFRVATPSGRQGWVRNDMVSDLWIKVLKKERRLILMHGAKVVKAYRIALSSFNPLGDKVKQGDGGTPEGRFFICEMIRNPGQAKYGARSMRLSYPNIEDARRGLKDGLIDQKAYWAVIKSIRAGRMPPQNTSLGGSIRIHGGGAQNDWTLGCVALEDEDVREIYEQVRPGTRVEIYRSATTGREMNADGYLGRKVLAGAKSQLVNPALYTEKAAGGPGLPYPMGDIDPESAVCTDIVIRALRSAGLDLQALVHEDALLVPGRYKRWIKKPNAHIDHRRVRNLQNYFTYNAEIMPDDRSYQPGDVVTMDTGIQNGTKFDHIGLIADEKDPQGLPLVINIWTVGFRTRAMDLLGEDYPTVVGHFRLTHLFDYQ